MVICLRCLSDGLHLPYFYYIDADNSSGFITRKLDNLSTESTKKDEADLHDAVATTPLAKVDGDSVSVLKSLEVTTEMFDSFASY